MAEKFNVVLKEEIVILVGADNIEKNYKVKELTGEQKSIYDDSFKMKFEPVNDGKDGKFKAIPSDDFKMFPNHELLAMALYDENDKLVTQEFVNKLPGAVLEALCKKVLKLSKMDLKSKEETAKAEEAVKND